MNILLTEIRSLTLDLPELPEVAPADASNFARLLRQQLPASTDSAGQVIEYNELYVSTGASIEAPVANLQQVSTVDWGEFLLPQRPLDAGEITPDAVTVDLNRALNAPVAATVTAALPAEAGEILPAGGKSLPDVVQSINPAPANGITATVVPAQAPMQIPLSAPVEASTIETTAGISAGPAAAPRPLQLAIAEPAVAVMPGPDAKLEIPAEMQRLGKMPALAPAAARSPAAPATAAASVSSAAVPADATRAAADGFEIAGPKPGLAGQPVTPETAAPKPPVTDTPLPTPLQVTSRVQNLNPAPTTAAGEMLRPPAPAPEALRSAIDSNLPGSTGNREQSTPMPAAESRPAPDVLARAQRDLSILPRDPVEVKDVDGRPIPAQTPARGDGLRAIELRDLASVPTQQPIAQSENASQQVVSSRAPEANLNTTAPVSVNAAAVASTAATAVSQPAPPVTGDTLPPQLETLQLSRQGDAREWGSGLGERVQWMINQKQNMATIRLDPPALGKLDVQVRIADDSATITIQTQLPQTRDLIDAASQRLRDFLQDSGYQNVNVDVSQRQDQQQARSNSGSPADAEQGPESDSERLLEDSSESVAHGYLEGDGLLDTFA